MALTCESVHSARALATWALRACAVILLVTGAYHTLQRLIFGIIQRDLELTFHVWEGIGENDPFATGLAMLMTGAALAFLSRRIARWMIVPAQKGCPACGYAVVEGGICPECGLRQD